MGSTHHTSSSRLNIGNRYTFFEETAGFRGGSKQSEDAWTPSYADSLVEIGDDVEVLHSIFDYLIHLV